MTNKRVLVTGADGFVGRWVCEDLLGRGHTVLAAVRSLNDIALPGRWGPLRDRLEWVECNLEDEHSVQQCVRLEPEWIYHLGAVASGSQARSDPPRAWSVNCQGTANLVYALENLSVDARLLFASTAEVYGRGITRPAQEADPVEPCSPYAASKAAAEYAVLEFHRRTGGEVIIARPCAQAGPGQADLYVLPAFARRALQARNEGRREIAVGNLEPVREFLDVRDVAPAFRTLLERGEPGEIYNVAASRGISLQGLLELIGNVVGWPLASVPDEKLYRKADIAYLVGDGSKLMKLGWGPALSLEQTVRDVVDDLNADA